MESTIKESSKSEIEIEVEISAEEFNTFFDKAVLNAGKNLEIHGFRKGNAPKNIIEEKMGKENILIEAADLAVKENYTKAILENKLEPISEPKIDILKLAQGNPLVFKAKVSILPETELGDYKEIVKRIKRKEILVDGKNIDDTLKWIQKSRSKLTVKNGPAQKGDFVEIEYSSPQIKALGQESGRKDAFIIGDGHFIPGFEDKLIEMKADEEKEFSLNIPKDFSFKQIAGQNINFKVKINSVQNVELSELNDEFAKSLGNFDSLEKLKENIKSGLLKEKKQEESQRIKNEILEKISEKSKIEIPDSLVKKEQNATMENLKKEISEKLKVSFEDYLSKIKKTEQEMFDSLEQEARKKVKNFLILRAIGMKEKVKISDEEIRSQANEILKQYPTPEKAEKNINFEQIKSYSRELIRNKKIFEILEKLITN